MIDLYTFTTPNGYKVSIMLEETGLPYRVRTVDIGRDEQFAPEFLAISPNNKIPAIVDSDGPGGAPMSLFESGAILMYLAEKAASPLLPAEPARRWPVVQWLMFQVAGFGPMLGQAHHFRHYAPETVPYGVERYTREARRLYGVLDKQLAAAPWVAGESYSIADIALYPWAALHDRQGVDLGDLPNVARWLAATGERPAVRRGMAVPAAEA
jgi:GST-like protein